MKSIIICFTILAMGLHNALAQNKMDNLKPNQYFDFWIGDWSLTWVSSNGVSTGENSIIKILDDAVIQENFSVSSNPNMNGYNRKSRSLKRRINYKRKGANN